MRNSSIIVLYEVWLFSCTENKSYYTGSVPYQEAHLLHKAHVYQKAGRLILDVRSSSANRRELPQTHFRMGTYELAKKFLEEVIISYTEIHGLPEVKSNSVSLAHYPNQFMHTMLLIAVAWKKLKHLEVGHRIEEFKIDL